MMRKSSVMNEDSVSQENEQVSHTRNLMLKHSYSRIWWLTRKANSGHPS